LDEDSVADLHDAMKTKAPLPPKEPSIYFDDIFENSDNSKLKVEIQP
jgi:hypothetical protein